MSIDIVELIRTGNVVRKPELKFSEFIVSAAEYFRENDLRLGQSYFNTLAVVRPDISERIRGTHLDAFYDNDRLPAMLAEVYRRW